MSRPFTLGGRLRHPLRGGAPAVRAAVRRLLANGVTRPNGVLTSEDLQALARALGMAEATRYFAPASSRRLSEEVMQVRDGTRDPKTWRPRKGVRP